ncbi:MAG: hypothetical protein HC927_11235 [Deltaproteobacteria bacterium]|nr:hypothetical protein [Deltaproteobacteria bacterium]
MRTVGISRTSSSEGRTSSPGDERLIVGAQRREQAREQLEARIGGALPLPPLVDEAQAQGLLPLLSGDHHPPSQTPEHLGRRELIGGRRLGLTTVGSGVEPVIASRVPHGK